MEALLAGIRGASTEASPSNRPADCSTSAIAPAPRRHPTPRARVALAILAVAIGGAALVRGQFASTTEVVEVFATVTDEHGEPATGLTADAFTVLEEGVAQPVTVFAAGDFPLTVAVVIDRSFSMTPKGLATAKAGAVRLVDQLRARDRMTILAIGGGVDTVAGFETPRESTREALHRVALWGSSPIGDTVVQAVDAIDRERGRRAVVLWSDGVEKEAQRARADVLEHVRRVGALVYPVAIASSITPLLSELAALSGGRVLLARDRKGAEAASGVIARELRHQYLLGYAPPAGAAGWRRIDVRVARPELKVRARLGYFAAGPAAKASEEAPPASNQ